MLGAFNGGGNPLRHLTATKTNYESPIPALVDNERVASES